MRLSLAARYEKVQRVGITTHPREAGVFAVVVLAGEAQQSAADYEDAITSFRQAIDRQTQNLEAISGAINCSYSMGDIRQAKQFIDLGRSVAQGNATFREMALQYELNYGDPEKVIKPRLEARDAGPDDETNWLNLASTYAAAARARTKAQDAAGPADYQQKARSTIEQAVAKFPDEPKFLAYFAKFAIESGDFPAAEQAALCFAGRPMQKGRPKTAIILCDFYDLAGKPDSAEKVLRDYPPARINHPITARTSLLNSFGQPAQQIQPLRRCSGGSPKQCGRAQRGAPEDCDSAQRPAAGRRAQGDQ